MDQTINFGDKIDSSGGDGSIQPEQRPQENVQETLTTQGIAEQPKSDGKVQWTYCFFILKTCSLYLTHFALCRAAPTGHEVQAPGIPEQAEQQERIAPLPKSVIETKTLSKAVIEEPHEQGNVSVGGQDGKGDAYAKSVEDPDAASEEDDKPLVQKSSKESGVPGDVKRSRRERKSVEHFKVEAPKSVTQVTMDGEGMKLRNIPNVAFKMSKITGKDELLEGLHNVIFRRKGQATTRKKAILEFNGLSFPEEEKERELEARKISLGKWKLELINRLMDLLDLQRGTGDKASNIDRIIEFLNVPSIQSTVDLAGKEVAKREKARRKREREEKRKLKAAKSKQNPKKKTEKKKADLPKETEKVVEEEEESENEEDTEESDAEVMPSAKVRRLSQDDVGDESDSNKAVELPASQIKKEVEAFLATKSDDELSQITPKMVLYHLENQHGIDLQSRKAEIKSAAQEYAERRLNA